MLTLARPLVSFLAVLVLLSFILKSDWAICVVYDHQRDFLKISAFMTAFSGTESCLAIDWQFS